MSINAWVYMLRCSDRSYYVGSHRGENVEVRVSQHQAGEGGVYTALRRPVELVWCDSFQQITDAIAVERQLKGWSRAKKEALIVGDWRAVSVLSSRRGGQPVAAASVLRPLRPGKGRAPQDEEQGR